MAPPKESMQKKLPLLASQALVIMLAIILLPALWFSIRLLLTPSKASDIILAISVGTFASVIYLWILDATSIIQFRSSWISKAVWGVAISSILSTSASIYSGYFAEDRYPYQGVWEFSFIESNETQTLPAVISYSQASETYQGFTGIVQCGLGSAGNDCKQYISFEIADFNPDKGYIIFRRHLGEMMDEFKANILIERNGKLIESKTPETSNNYVGFSDLGKSKKIRLMRRN